VWEVPQSQPGSKHVRLLNLNIPFQRRYLRLDSTSCTPAPASASDLRYAAPQLGPRSFCRGLIRPIHASTLRIDDERSNSIAAAVAVAIATVSVPIRVQVASRNGKMRADAGGEHHGRYEASMSTSTIAKHISSKPPRLHDSHSAKSAKPRMRSNVCHSLCHWATPASCSVLPLLTAQPILRIPANAMR
jgi:hypothetical protein